jgi:hypothetical protein
MVVVWFVVAVVTAIAANARGRSGFGWLILGFLFSIFALIAVLVLPKVDPNAPNPRTHIRCPDCRESHPKRSAGR